MQLRVLSGGTSFSHKFVRAGGRGSGKLARLNLPTQRSLASYRHYQAWRLLEQKISLNQLKSNNNFGTSKRIILESVCDKKSEVVQIFLPTKNGNSGSPQILNQTVLERILGITEKCKSVYNQTIRIVTETPHNLYRFLMIKFWPLGKGPTVRNLTVEISKGLSQIDAKG